MATVAYCKLLIYREKVEKRCFLPEMERLTDTVLPITMSQWASRGRCCVCEHENHIVLQYC